MQGKRLYRPLLQHSSSDLHEAGDICAFHIVHTAVRLGAIFDTCLMNGLHDEVQLIVNFLSTPADMRSVLGHFKT